MNRMKTLREELRYTQQELADRLECSKSVIGLYESETRKPSLEVLVKLSEIFDCSIDYILGKSDIRNPKKESEYENIQKYYEQEASNLLKKKYLNRFLTIKLTESEIANLDKILTNRKMETNDNYYVLINSFLSLLSLNHNQETINKAKELIIDYYNERIELLEKQVSVYEKKIKKQDEKLKAKHIDKLHPSISGKENASIEENLESIIKYMEKNGMKQMELIPIIGKIAAGQPILAEEYIEGYLPVDPNVYGVSTAEDLFYLRIARQFNELKS